MQGKNTTLYSLFQTIAGALDLETQGGYRVLSQKEKEEVEMNTQLLGSGKFPVKGKDELDGFEDEHDALNKKVTKVTVAEESLDFQDLESIMWRKV